MGNNDAREQLEVCKEEFLKLEAEMAEAARKIAALLSGFRATLVAAVFNEEMIDKILEEYK
jgi:hypothetical protein